MKALFTGGGTAGHVTPNLALMEAARARGWDCCYAGSADGIEASLVAAAGVRFYSVSAGKLRRYFSWRNFTDPFRVLLGIAQSLIVCRREKPDAVFSKGGYVALPVVMAAWLLRLPVIGHESDVTPGLATRLCLPFCKRVCLAFPQTAAHLPAGKTLVTGTPLRASLLQGQRRAGLACLGLKGEKPLLLVFGGSLGASRINAEVRRALPALLQDYDLAHVTGKGKLAKGRQAPGYRQREFLAEDFGHVLAAADLVVSRAGANALYELLALRKPHLLIPLPATASRGDQLANAQVFAEAGLSQVLPEEALTPEALIASIAELRKQSPAITRRLAHFPQQDSANLILDLLEAAAK